MQAVSKQLKLNFAVLSAAALLSACGGGGSGGGTPGGTTVTTTTTTTVPAAGSIVTSVNAPGYGPGSEYMNAYTYLNNARSTCGFGLLQDTNAVDNAAQAHANWLQNYNTSGHIEDPAKPTFFTGVAPPDRLTAAGYVWTGYGEVTYLYNGNMIFGTSIGASGVMHSFMAPYHGYASLLGYRDIGIGYASKPAANGFPAFYWLNIDLGSTAARPTQQLPTNTVATYPCSGTTGVLAKSYADETPQPIAGRNLQNTPIGTPIYLKVRDGQTLLLTTYTLQKTGSGVNENLIKLDKGSDANALIQDNSAIVLMPNAPLLTNTQYTFTATGTNNGQAAGINFNFTTGAN